MKIIFEILLAGAVASLAATACGDMDSIHERYSCLLYTSDAADEL